MIVLSLIMLTYYTTVFLVYGRIALNHSSKSQAATGVIVVYNILVSRLAGRCQVLGFLTLPAYAGRHPGLHVVVELLCGGVDRTGKSTARLAAERRG